MIAHTMNAFKQISQLGQIPQVETAMPPRIDQPFPGSTQQKAKPYAASTMAEHPRQ